MLHAGLAPLVREGDRLSAMFTVRNATDRALSLRAAADLTADGPQVALPTLEPKVVELAAGEARELTWDLEVPAGATALRWEVRVETRRRNGEAITSWPARRSGRCIRCGSIRPR